MLQSRLRGAIIGKTRKKLGVNWEMCKSYVNEDSAASQEVAPTQGYAPLPTGIAADPAVHSSDPPQGQDTEEAIKTNEGNRPLRTTADEPDPLVSPTTPISSSPRLGHVEVGQSSNPNSQQRREFSVESDNVEAQKAQKKAQERDNKEYFKHRKASPLSEVEFADTRKPVSQKTDSPTTYYGGDPGMMVWSPEQVESAEDTLLGAIQICNLNKMRGDPESPHGRVLRELRGENW